MSALGRRVKALEQTSRGGVQCVVLPNELFHGRRPTDQEIDAALAAKGEVRKPNTILVAISEDDANL